MASLTAELSMTDIAEVVELIRAASDLGCVCQYKIGHPAITDHSAKCKRLKAALKPFADMEEDDG